MLYGLFIGLIISSLFILQQNPDEIRLPYQALLIRGTIRCICLMVLITSICALAGLIIQDL